MCATAEVVDDDGESKRTRRGVFGVCKGVFADKHNVVLCPYRVLARVNRRCAGRKVFSTYLHYCIGQ